jgi:hypothetical protein
MRLLQPGGSITHISTAATTQCTTGEGVLRNIVVNGGVLTGTITVYDDTASNAGSIIAIIGANNVVGSGGYPYYAQLKNGCRIVTSAAVDISVTVDQ